MTIAMTCKCGKALKARESLAGKRGKCPRCGAVFTVPLQSEHREAGPVISSTAPTAPSEKFRRRRSRRLAVIAVPSAVVLLGATIFYHTGQADTPVKAAAQQISKVPNGSQADGQGPVELAAETGTMPEGTSEGSAPSKQQSANHPQAMPQANAEEITQDTAREADALEASSNIVDLPSPISIESSELRVALSNGLKLIGTLSPESVSQTFGMGTQSYHRWDADIRLENQSPATIALGGDLFLLEISSDGSTYEGFAVFGEASDVVGPASYGLENNYEREGTRINHGGGRITFTFSGWEGSSFGRASHDKPWTLKREFPEHSWLRDPAEIWLVLPELQVNTSAGIQRFRLLAQFRKAIYGSTWSVREQRLVALQSTELTGLLADQTSNLVTKVLAANWMAEVDPRAAQQSLAAAATPLRDGQLLGSCLTLMKNLKAPGLERHALGLLSDSSRPNGIRALSARYLGVLRHGPSLEPLIAATADDDSAVARGAMDGLGLFGGARSVASLAQILRDTKRSEDHRCAAANLAVTKEKGAIQVLQDAVDHGNQMALEALCSAGLPETFDFFVTLAETSKNAEWRDEIARGLRATGGVKSLTALLRMLEQVGPAGTAEEYNDGPVNELAKLDDPEATPMLIQLARTGNLSAAEVLARSENKSVMAPLADLAAESNGKILCTVLDGLADHWAEESVDVFLAALTGRDEDAICAAIRGMKNSKNPESVRRMAPLLEHTSERVRSSAAWAIKELPLGDEATRLAEILLRSSDSDVISACVDLIIAADWRAAPILEKVGEKLRLSDESVHYDLIRLLRHLSDNEMGPKDDSEWYQDKEGWRSKWIKLATNL